VIVQGLNDAIEVGGHQQHMGFGSLDGLPRVEHPQRRIGGVGAEREEQLGPLARFLRGPVTLAFQLPL